MFTYDCYNCYNTNNNYLNGIHTETHSVHGKLKLCTSFRLYFNRVPGIQLDMQTGQKNKTTSCPHGFFFLVILTSTFPTCPP